MDERSKRTLPTPVEFLTEYDLDEQSKKKFEDKFVRQTFLIEKRLLERMDAFLKKRPRFKTKLINYALERCLDEMLTPIQTRGSEVGLEGVRTHGNTGQLSRSNVMTLLSESWTSELLLSKEDIEVRLMRDLFLEGRDTTGLVVKLDGRFESPRRKIGRGYRAFDSAEACVRDLIAFYNDEEVKNKHHAAKNTKSPKTRMP